MNQMNRGRDREWVETNGFLFDNENNNKSDNMFSMIFEDVFESSLLDGCGKKWFIDWPSPMKKKRVDTLPKTVPF